MSDHRLVSWFGRVPDCGTAAGPDSIPSRINIQGLLKTEEKVLPCSDNFTWLDFLVFSDNNENPQGPVSQYFHIIWLCVT